MSEGLIVSPKTHYSHSPSRSLCINLHFSKLSPDLWLHSYLLPCHLPSKGIHTQVFMWGRERQRGENKTLFCLFERKWQRSRTMSMFMETVGFLTFQGQKHNLLFNQSSVHRRQMCMSVHVRAYFTIFSSTGTKSGNLFHRYMLAILDKNADEMPKTPDHLLLLWINA